MSSLFASNPASTPPEPARKPELVRSSGSAARSGRTPERLPRWLERGEMYLRVLLWMELGLFVCYLPWSGQIFTALPWSHALWDHNPLFVHFSALGVYAASGAVRGLISGLGLLNVWYALRDALRHWDK